jgi:hypothetical protein
MTNWIAINPNELLPSSLVTAIKGMESIVSGFLSDIRNPLSAIASLPTLPSKPDVTTAVVNAILDTLSGLLKAGNIHTLVVPITKTVPNRVPLPAPPTLDALQNALNITLGPANSDAATAYADMVANTGGNAGFYNQFAASIMDLRDPNRPQYENQSDAVVMVTLLVGAPRFSQIVTAASTLSVLTTPKGDNSFTARTTPIPQNVRSRVVGATTAPNIGIRLDWEAPEPVTTPIYFPGVSMKVKRYAVIRSTDPRIQSARSVTDLFSTKNLTEGLKSEKHKVVKIGSGANTAFFDSEAVIDPKVPIYYCITWEIEVTENGSVEILAFDRLSNVTKVVAKAPEPQQTGDAPNWSATGSAIEAFPSLNVAANRLIEEARVLLVPRGTPTSRIQQGLDLSKGASARLAARATELINDVQRVAAALSAPIPSLYVTQMSSTSGGNAFLLAELAKRLGDPSDSSRPPFDHGEYVCGVCFVSGAPRLADLAPIITFFEALFGPAGATNPLQGILDSIDTLVTQAEVTVFQPGMTPFPPGTDLTGIDPATGRPTVPTTPVISAAGIPVAGASPDNPNAGDTNVTPPSTQC